jgi:hypothetical protein
VQACFRIQARLEQSGAIGVHQLGSNAALAPTGQVILGSRDGFRILQQHQEADTGFVVELQAASQLSATGQAKLP